ncbi:caspase family protein [Jiella marina]|uniref:caspase family protein n=1 Tax=Jiella sp. LLJ827 TaxID=2917712 RepID=UPI002101C76A|nr:caspase family protein [Jiella sp. LLJ827]MCQ0990455.1 caspase family protein [Jiella sp. LLJ827]
MRLFSRRSEPERCLGRLVAAMALLVIAAGLTTPAMAEGRRVALVIGNDAYAHVDQLDNAVADARLIAGRLETLGFDVAFRRNLSKRAFEQTIAEFERKAETAEAALLYFAGHGFQFEGQNHLVPVDARLDTKDTALGGTVELTGILTRLADVRRPTIVFLDSCRNDPLPESFRAAGGNARLGTPTLGRDVGNVYVAYATVEGEVTYDGGGDHGPFAESLAEAMTMPDADLSGVLRRVRRDVLQRTGGLQMTQGYDTLISEKFRFAAPSPGGPAIGFSPFAPSLASGGVQTASLEPSVEIRGLPPGGGLPALPLERSEDTPVPLPEPDDLAAQLQTELKRLGCYRGRIDNDWGPMSRRALEEYFNETGVKGAELEPDIALLDRFREKNVEVCKTVVASPPPNEPAASTRSRVKAKVTPPRKKTVTTRRSNARKKVVKRAPTPRVAQNPAPRSSGGGMKIQRSRLNRGAFR